MTAGFGLASLAATALVSGVIAVAVGEIPLALLFVGGALAAAAAAALLIRRHARRRVRRRRRDGATSQARWGPPVRQRSADRPPFTLERDPASGRVTGRVIRGAHAGRSLDTIPLADLLALAGQMGTGDPHMVALLEEFLDRAHPGWDASAEEAPSAQVALDAARMTEAEAYRVLGLAPGAAAQQVAAAHRRLIRKVHPDVGGSDVLAAQVNAAKARLMR